MSKKKSLLLKILSVLYAKIQTDGDFEDSGSEYSTESSDKTESCSEIGDNLNVPFNIGQKNDEP